MKRRNDDLHFILKLEKFGDRVKLWIKDFIFRDL